MILLSGRLKPEQLYLKLFIFIAASFAMLVIIKPFPAMIFMIFLALGIFFIPAIFLNGAYQAALRGDFKRAEKLGRYYKFLIYHPRAFKQEEMLKALNMAEKDKSEEAKAIFHKHFVDEDPETASLAFTLYGYIFDYSDLMSWFESSYINQNKEIPKQMRSIYIRALLDAIKINEAVEYFSKIEDSFSMEFLDTFRKNLALLAIFAYTGRRDRVFALSKKLYPFHEDSRKSWIAMAELVSGNKEEGNRLFDEIYSTVPEYKKKRIDRVKADLQGAPETFNLTDATKNIVDKLEIKYYTPEQSNLDTIRPLLLKIILVLLLILAVFLFIYIYYKPVCPLRNYHLTSTQWRSEPHIPSEGNTFEKFYMKKKTIPLIFWRGIHFSKKNVVKRK